MSAASFPPVSPELQAEFVQFLQQRLLDTKAQLDAGEKVRDLKTSFSRTLIPRRRNGKSCARSLRRPKMVSRL